VSWSTIPCAALRGVNSLLDVLYPRTCVACGEPRPEGLLDLCRSCAASLPRVKSEDLLYRRTRERLCATGVIDDVVAPYFFEQDGPLQPVIHALKYQGMKRIGLALGREVARSLRRLRGNIPLACAVPVPLHRARLRERGYNQSLCLCCGVTLELQIPTVECALVRRRYTSTQTALSAAERRENVHGAFVVRPAMRAALVGSSVLLMDDVITTGSTMLECAAALRAAGVAHVVAGAAAIAR
jgi:ComF family protein